MSIERGEFIDLSDSLGKDPNTERYTQTEMRQHLTLCFEKKMTSFPNSNGRRQLGRHRIIHRKKVDVFCICRLPWDRYDGKHGPLVQCIRCKEWYHQKCLNIDQDIVNEPSAKFTCSICLYLD